MAVQTIGRGALRAAQHLMPRARRGVMILAYHLIEAGSDSPVDLPLSVFRQQLRELQRIAEVWPLERALAALAEDRLPDRPVAVVTFDDAYENFYTSAWPALREMNMPATLYVPVGFIEGETGSPIAGADVLRPATWAQLREMCESGLLSIGSHGWMHADARWLGESEARRELMESRRALEDRLGVAVRGFCYPRGMWSPEAERRVGEQYEHAVIGGGRKVTPKNFQPLRLWRVSLRRDMPERLAPFINRHVCLEEWLADHARRMRRNGSMEN